MKPINKFINESTCGGYNSGDADQVAQALIGTCSVDIKDEKELDDYCDEDGWWTFDLEAAAEELKIDVDDLQDYLDNYGDRVMDCLYENLPITSC